MKIASLAAVGLALAACMGCASKEKVKPDPVPVSAATPQAAPVEAASSQKTVQARYTVLKGDSLWKISAKDEVLGDSFHWPLLYRQNRDQIADPDIIDIGQDLDYGQAMSAADIKAAEELAKETPPFVPHATARKTLPLNY